MAADLPKEFDVVVLGTGMPESIVAAACSRIGQAVLHLDRNEYYSGDWASFNLQGIETWAKQFQASEDTQGIQRPNVDENGFLEADESLIQLSLVSNSYSNVNLNFHVEKGEEIVEPNKSRPKQPDQTEVVNEVNKSAVGVTDTITESSDIHPEPIEQTLSEGVKNIEINEEIVENKNTQSAEEYETKKSEILENKKSPSVESDETKTDDILENKNAQSVERDETKTDGENSQKDDNNASCDYRKIDSVSEENNSTQGDEAKLKMSEAPAHIKKWTVNRLKAEWRKFNLDLSPKVIYSGGDMVELLISSDIAKYCEFKTVTRMLTLLNGELEKVPCSRSDVFSSKKVSMIEKRMLMKFLQFCAEYENKAEEIADFLHRPFPEFLAHKKLTANVSHYIQHSIAMATNSTTTEQGLKQMKKFIKSVGRYGNTAFLWSLYGSGELPQSFCRMCAVFGGLYCLRMSASSMIVNKENKCTGIVTTEGQKISCKWLIMENSYAPPNFINQATSRMSRAIIMTDKPLLDSDQQELSLMSLPCPDDADRPIVVLELPPSSQACPKNTYTFHLTRKGLTDVTPEDDLCYAVNKLFNQGSETSEDRPTILWSLYFSQCDMSCVNVTDQVPTNVILMSGPGPEIDIDRPVKEAREVFAKILPEEEFLPKAPNPEDIIYVDDSEAQVAKDNSLSEFEDTDNNQSETSTAEKPDNDTEVIAAKEDCPSELKDTDERQFETSTEDKLDNSIEISESAEGSAKVTEDKTLIETVGMDSKDKET